jgi:hypothetical protein
VSDQEIPPVFLAYGALRGALELHYLALASVVDEFGVVEAASVPRVSRAGGKRDFIFFCVTKSCKTVAAIGTLLDSFFSEETYPLTRTLYEHYIATACVINDDKYLDEFLTKPIGLSAGTLRYPTSKRGKPIHRELIHSSSGTRLSGIATVGELARSTGYKYDTEIHRVLYSFLSEHTHPNMLGSGNYRDSTQARYSYSEKTGLLQAAFWACFVSAMMVSEVSKFIRGRGSILVRERLKEANDASLEALHEALEILKMTRQFAPLPGLVRARLRARRRPHR